MIYAMDALDLQIWSVLTAEKAPSNYMLRNMKQRFA